MTGIRVLMLDNDDNLPTYHAEDTSSWHDANHFIKWLTRPRSVIIPYEVRTCFLVDLDIELAEKDIDIEHIFNIVYFCGRGYSFEEYQEAFNILWEYSKEI